MVREIHASRGIVNTKYAAEETRTYTVRNVDRKAKTLIVEHPLRPGYTLLSQKAAEKTATNYRFELALAAGATQEFVVNEERVWDQSIVVTNLTPDILVSYLQNRSLTAAGRQQLQRIVDRVRRNIQSLNNVAGQQQQVQTYARQLDAQEQQLAALRDKQAELQKKKSVLQGDLDKLVEALTF